LGGKAADESDGSMSVDTNRPAAPPQQQLKGIGGWLILVAIGQVGGAIKVLAFHVQYYSSADTRAGFASYPVSASGELVLNLVYAAMVFFATYAFFAQKRYFRLLFVIEALSILMLPFIDAAWIAAITKFSFWELLENGDAARAVLSSIPGFLWMIYMFSSERVKNTFVN
jgi:hypothetical protein